MARLSILLATLMLQTVVSQGTRGSIEGIVVQDPSGKPLAKASIELTVVEGQRVVSRTAKSGEDGRFQFVNLPPGEGYQIVVTGPGFWPAAYGQQRSYGPWTPITLAPGQHLTDVRVAAHAITQIGGRVLDSLGNPQVGASVLVMKATYVDGRREIQRAAGTVTNLRGEYHFSNVAPGRYYVRVSPRNEGKMGSLFLNPALHDRDPSTGGSAKETEGYPTVYYPGVPIESAKAIPLGDSEVREDIDITVAKAETTRVRGTIMNNATGIRVPAAQVSLLPIGSSPDSNWSRFFASKDGSFDLRAVLPGKYFLNAVAAGTGGPLAGRVAVEIRRGETRTFEVRVAPGTDIRGRIALEDRNAIEPNFSPVSVSVVPRLSEPVDATLSRMRSQLPSSSTSVKADGTFTLPGVLPWDYHVNVSGIPGAYVKAVRYGGEDVLASGIRVDGNDSTGNQPMEIVLATDGGRLDGRVLERNSARIVLVPEARQRHDLYFAVSTSNTARFQFTNVPPGRYKVFAWEKPAEGAWTDPDYLDRYESYGTPVEIQGESSEYLEIHVIPEVLGVTRD